MVASSLSREEIPHYRANYGGVPSDFLVAGNAVGDYCYYRQPNGWITVAEIGKRNAAMHRYQDQGWTSLLNEYGAFDFPKEYYVHHPLEVLFLRGGAHELPVAQVQALGFDRYPPKLPRCNLALGSEHTRPTGRPLHFDRCWQGAQTVTFPQLAGLTPDPVPQCEFCERDDFASKKAREQHMRVLHIDELKEIAAAREMASGMRDAMNIAVSGRAAQPGVGFPVAGMAAQPFACGFCSETFAGVRSLSAHVKLHDELSPGDDPDDDGGT